MNARDAQRYATELVVERSRATQGYYPTLLAFIATITEMDERVLDANILKVADIDMDKLREAGL